MVTPALPAEVRPGGRFEAWRGDVPAYVVCDVDGTLVGPTVDASDEVVAAVRRAQAHGVRVGLATGRMRAALETLLAQLDATGPHVVHNGAEVRAEGATIAAWTLTDDQVDALLALARARDDTYLEIYTDERYHVSAWDQRARPHWELLGIEPSSVLTGAADLDGDPVRKATFAAFDPAAVEELVTAIEAAGLLAGAAGSPRTPGLTYVNATHADADKGRALAVAATHLGVGLDATVAIGDAANDLSMLAVAGTAVAMGQAPEPVIAAAHLVVPDVDGHGVAVALDAVRAWRNGA